MAGVASMRDKILQKICEILLLASIVGAFVIFFLVAKKLLFLGCG